MRSGLVGQRSTSLDAAHPTGRVIRASEIGAFVYCARAWWLGTIIGLPTKNTSALQQGVELHRRHAVKVVAALVLLGVALALAGLALWLVLIGV
ncbi:MAG: hypothetical protein RMM31_09075 [Anaerolineae bacterium]|nr:hypothetical protein [Thermoflexales bacterium]MDW8396381.1 hypothetical protein [Anaerolineae bacterium]